MTNKEADVYVLTFSHYIEDERGKRVLVNAPFTITGFYGYGLKKVNDYEVFNELSMHLHDALMPTKEECDECIEKRKEVGND